jgi:peptidoglycan/LPS O-acetylase OafA/YrhL
MSWPWRLGLGLVLSVAFASAMRYAVELPLQRLRARFRRVPELDPTAPDGHGLVS